MNKREFVAATTAREFALIERALAVAVRTESFDKSEKRKLTVVLKRAQRVNALGRREGK